jgi:hypothetical protein
MAGPNRIVARSGSAVIEIDQSEVIAQIDRITKGAVNTFLKAAHGQMDPVVAEAKSDRTLWPRRTGASQGATVIVDRIGADSLEVVALNRVAHTFKLRFSVVTAGTIDREARQVAASIWSRLGPRVDRAGQRGDVTQRGKFRGRSGAKRRVAHHWFRAHAAAEPWGKWWLKADPSEEVIRRGVKANLINRHGTGAPSEAMAGKHVWSTRVRNPVNKRAAAVIAESREALDILARG